MIRHSSKAPNLRRARALFEGHTVKAYTLPAELLDLRGAIVALDAELAVEGPRPAEAEEAYLSAVIAAAKGGKPTPPASTLIESVAAAEAHGRRRRALSDAMGRLDNEVGAYVSDMAESILVGNLRPALADVWQRIRALVEKLPDGDVTAETLIRATDAARKSWLDLSEQAKVYGIIQAAAGVLRRASGETAKWGEAGMFGEVRNFDHLTKGYVVQLHGARPWPEDTVGRLIWFARHDAEVWLPTVAEMDEAYFAANREQIERMSFNHQQLGGTMAAA